MNAYGEKEHFTSHLAERYDIIRAFSTLPTGVIVSWIGKTKTGEAVLLRYYPLNAENKSKRFRDKEWEGWAHIREVIPGENKILLIRDWVNGLTLSDLIIRRETKPHEQEARDLFAAICATLEPLDETADVHGALKPTNIFLREDKSIILTDPLLTDTGIYQPDISLEAFNRTILPYLSPEHIQGKQVTTASDVYSLGCIMYEWLTGKHLFDTGTIFLDYQKHLTETPAGIRSLRPDLSPELEAIIATALHKESSSRFSSWKDFGVALGKSRTFYPGKISATTESSMVLSSAGKQTDKQLGEEISPERQEGTQPWETMRLSQKAIQEALELARSEKSESETHEAGKFAARETDKNIHAMQYDSDINPEKKYKGSSKQTQKREQSASQSFLWLIIIIEALMIVFLCLLLMMNKPG